MRRMVGMMVLGSMKSVQSRKELGDRGVGVGWEDGLSEVVFCGSSLLDLELHGGHRISAHSPACRRERSELRGGGGC